MPSARVGSGASCATDGTHSSTITAFLRRRSPTHSRLKWLRLIERYEGKGSGVRACSRKELAG